MLAAVRKVPTELFARDVIKLSHQ